MKKTFDDYVILKKLKKKDGYILVYAFLMITILFVLMAGIVSMLGYTNNATNKKIDSQQLQLTAQSSIQTLKEEFSKTENLTKLTSYVQSNAVQDFDLSAAGISDKVTAKVTQYSGNPRFALLTVIASNGSGSYETSTLIPMTPIAGEKNGLINNMIVSYWPDSDNGFISGRSLANNVMNGAVIVDNESYKSDSSSSYRYGNGNSATPNDDSYSVKIKGGTFKELVTTGNLYLDATLPITGIDGATIASAAGQLYIRGTDSGSIGDGTDGIKELGAGGYYVNKFASDRDSKRKRDGDITIDGVNFKDAVNIYSRDSVDLTMTDIQGIIKNIYSGGALKMTLKDASDKSLEVTGDIQGYKAITLNTMRSKLNIGKDLVSGTGLTIKMGGSNTTIGESITTATGNIDISGSGTLTSDSILSGKGVKVTGATKVNLTGEKQGYSLFTGGNYAVGGSYGSYLDKTDRGDVSLTGNVDLKKPAVYNNSKGNTKNENSAGLNAFKRMNTLWLSKAQKVYKGGVWGSGSSAKINFAVALLFDPSVDSSFSSAINYMNDLSNKQTTFFSSATADFNPKSETNTAEDLKKNAYYFTHKSDKYSGNQYTPVSHGLYYTTNDSKFLLRSDAALRGALGGPKVSYNLNLGDTYQGRFIDKARTAIPKDGAIDEITIQYPSWGNFGGLTVDQSDYASVIEYNDGYLIGTNSNNFGKIVFTQGGNLLKIGDKQEDVIDVRGKTLYFNVTEPGLPGGYGDFFMTSTDSSPMINCNIVVNYTLDGTDAESIEKLSFVRFFLDSNITFQFNSGMSITGNNLSPTFDSDNVNFEYNEFKYTKIMPEVYFFCQKPSSSKSNIVLFDNVKFNAYIITPWSYVDMTRVQASANEEIFSGIILCKDLMFAQGGTFNHYKPLTFGYAMADNVFTLPERVDVGEEE